MTISWEYRKRLLQKNQELEQKNQELEIDLLATKARLRDVEMDAEIKEQQRDLYLEVAKFRGQFIADVRDVTGDQYGDVLEAVKNLRKQRDEAIRTNTAGKCLRCLDIAISANKQARKEIAAQFSNDVIRQISAHLQIAVMSGCDSLVPVLEQLMSGPRLDQKKTVEILK